MRTRRSKAQTQQRSKSNLAEEALRIAVENMDLDEEMIKALRLTCKRTKVAADGRVKYFTLCMDQEPEAVDRSGLLKNVTSLQIVLRQLDGLDGQIGDIPGIAFRALSLIKVAVDVCAEFLEVLDINNIDSSPMIFIPCAAMLGDTHWASLKSLYTIDSSSPMPDFLTTLLETPYYTGNFPALEILWCSDPTSDDVESLCNSNLIENLESLRIDWTEDAFDDNVSPDMISAMRDLLQRATHLQSLHITSSTFEFFDCENLVSLMNLVLASYFVYPEVGIREIDFGPALVRKWETLYELHIENAHFNEPDLVRLFEAEDCLPILETLTLKVCIFQEDALAQLSCVRRPLLKNFKLFACHRGYALLSKLAQLMENNEHVAPVLDSFAISFISDEDQQRPTREALCKFLACPAMAELGEFKLRSADIGADGSYVLYHLAKHCRKLMHLDLSHINLGRQALIILAGYGHMGAWPELHAISGITQLVDGDDDGGGGDNNVAAEHSFMPQLDAQTMLRRYWPRLHCWEACAGGDE